MKLFFKNKLVSAISKALKWQYYYSLEKQFNNPNVHVGKGVIIDNYFSLKLPDDNFLLKIGDNVDIRKYCNIDIHPNAKLILEKRVFFNNYVSVNCLGNIFIDEDTLIGEGVKLYDHNHKYEYQQNHLNIEKYDFNIGKIIIGKNCFIGSNVTILNNVQIGDNVVIGANNLIYKSIPEGTMIRAKSEFLFNKLEQK